jgi:hypothetical protein
MNKRRFTLLILIALGMTLSAGCYARIIGPPLLIPVPVPFGGWGDYHRGYYYRDGYR